MSDESYATRVLQRVDALAAKVERHLVAGSPDVAATVANLRAMYSGALDTAAALDRELTHYAAAAEQARCERDEALTRLQELEDELTELRGGLAAGVAASCGGKA
ncbi:hypothetical protein PBI_SQUIRTY_47 [Mycobacterium phage Squirty]|uniref:Uncharacterized protein n=1 Tax=Mycobacterium phage Squirty TaxID=1527512 RepID=A0A088FBN5_9CAUD|nr:hypothetical protein PBI_SQUIRTY_47 [Mycobacterium phage Squirty]AIM40994.1 hypothetical protein PBI_SQUIRTY_47 [Mycobacterium phage Squirty]